MRSLSSPSLCCTRTVAHKKHEEFPIPRIAFGSPPHSPHTRSAYVTVVRGYAGVSTRLRTTPCDLDLCSLVSCLAG